MNFDRVILGTDLWQGTDANVRCSAARREKCTLTFVTRNLLKFVAITCFLGLLSVGGRVQSMHAFVN
jgi:hypothetical protein